MTNRAIPIACLCLWAVLLTFEPKTTGALAFPLAHFAGVIVGNLVIASIIVAFYTKIRKIIFGSFRLSEKIRLCSIVLVAAEIPRLILIYRYLLI